MPINATHEFFKAEDKYNQAKTISDKIAGLEEMLKTAPSHKGAENLRAQIKQKLSKLRVQIEKERKQTTKGGKTAHLMVKKEGAAQVALVSLTNAGKSSIINVLTNAKPRVAEFAYTTTKAEVGIMHVGGINIQLVEIPALFKDFAYNGDGPTYFSIIRNVDLVVYLIDTTKDEQEQLSILNKEFEKAQIKLNEEKPKVVIKKQGIGGIEILGKKYLTFPTKEAVQMLVASGYHNATVTVYAKITIEDLADVLNESLVYLPLLIVYTKGDISGKGVSIKNREALEKLRNKIFEDLRLIKVYTKTPGKPKQVPPVALHKGDTIKTLASTIHKDFLIKFRFARVWGNSTKHDGQTFGLEHELKDEDVVEFHLN
jgi:uncharacterized protein